MPRMLLLGVFLGLGFVAFMAGNLFAGEPEIKSKPSYKFKQRKSTPTDSLAKLLQASKKKSSTESKLTTSKKTSRLKSAHHKTRTSKKLATHKTTTSKKSAYHKTKSKSLKKSTYHKRNPSKKIVSGKSKSD